MKHFIGFWLLLLAVSGCSQDRQKTQTISTPPSTSPTNATVGLTIPRFDGKAAYAYLLKQTSYGPRNPNSAGHEACLAYLNRTLQELADTVSLQRFSHQGYDETLSLTNIFARFRPHDTTRILFLAHWDTRPRAENDEDKSRRNQPILGANDGASGVAVLLELASLLKHTPPPIGVDILLVDGEDYGKEGDHDLYLLGTRYFAKVMAPAYAPRFGILLDMVGDTFLELPKEANSVQYAPDIVDLVWSTAHNLGVRQFVDAVGEAIIDDHLPLNEAGIKTIDIIDFNYPDPTNRYWHSLKDTPDHCSAESLEAVGTVITEVMYLQRP
ncbi:MAG: M28 family peptidase [Bacteroidota bacterium]